MLLCSLFRCVHTWASTFFLVFFFFFRNKMWPEGKEPTKAFVCLTFRRVLFFFPSLCCLVRISKQSCGCFLKLTEMLRPGWRCTTDYLWKMEILMKKFAAFVSVLELSPNTHTFICAAAACRAVEEKNTSIVLWLSFVLSFLLCTPLVLWYID